MKLPCNVDQDENNKITNIVWTKDDLSLQVGVEDRIDFGYDGSLTIFNVQKRHEGRYKCKVKTLRDEASAEVEMSNLSMFNLKFGWFNHGLGSVEDMIQKQHRRSWISFTQLITHGSTHPQIFK